MIFCYSWQKKHEAPIVCEKATWAYYQLSHTIRQLTQYNHHYWLHGQFTMLKLCQVCENWKLFSVWDEYSLCFIAQVYGSDFLNLINYSLSKYLLRDTFSTPCTSNVRQHKSGHQIRIIIILPVQLYPSPLKPLSHSHVYEPSVFVQMAFLSHLCLPSMHSSLS